MIKKNSKISRRELERRLSQQRRDMAAQLPLPISVTSTEETNAAIEILKNNSHWLVNNWRSGWKWLSSWTFAVIAYIAVSGIPPEIMALIPEASKDNVIGALAGIGLIFRFINQSKNKNIPFLKVNP